MCQLKIIAQESPQQSKSVSKLILNVRLVERPAKPMKILRVVNEPILNVMHVKELVKPMNNLRVINKPILKCQARKRAHETREQSQNRKKANSKRQASSRLCETSEQSQNRKQADLVHHAHKRAQQSSSQNIIESFLAKTKQGPDYVCKSCHRLLYRQDGPASNANIHGAITSISPIKKGRKSSFLEAMIADHTSQVRLVGFNNQQQIQLRDLHVKKSPVKISNCQIKTSRRGLGFDILLKTDSMISKSSVDMDIDEIVIPQDEPQNITLNELPTLD